jgi:pyruvate-formate lyase-activating enzyme
MKTFDCRLNSREFSTGSCAVDVNGKSVPACQATLKYENSQIYRPITSIHLSRPENYLSIYQSGCNFSCRKFHSWDFTKVKQGAWYTPHDIFNKARTYDKLVTLEEPRTMATAWHAHDSCRCCGSCVTYGERSPACPAVLDPKTVVLSPQGYGPARNIAAFTGGDVMCCPGFYGECARLIKESTGLCVLLETNGYGLTPQNLDYLQTSGVDAFWLDIKAFDSEKQKYTPG